MSVLVVGMSHKSAPVAMLERLALDTDGITKLLTDVAAIEPVGEVAVISTCNRVEVYAEVERFHGSVEDVSRLLAERADLPLPEVVDHFYVHYDQSAVSHLFHVASGLDSMAVGESQILGQVRDALRGGQEHGSVGSALNLLFQQALRVGKRAHAETDIDAAAPSLVGIALDEAVAGQLAGARVVVVGAGSMAALATATLSRLAPADLVVLNRNVDNARDLAVRNSENGLDVRWAGLEALAAEVSAADLVLACTGAAGIVVTRSMIAAARPDGAAPLAIIDLALPHDVEPEVAELPGVTLVNLAHLADRVRSGAVGAEIEAVREIVLDEVAAFMGARRRASVTPTVVALRTMATTLVDTEMARLDARLPDLDPTVRDELLLTVRRVADKLVHQPTIRVRELADAQDPGSYAAALAELFALDPEAVAAVTRVEGLE